MSGKGAPLVTLVAREHDPDRRIDIKPLQFFRLFKRLFTYTKPHATVRNWLLTLVLMRSIQLPLLAWSLAAVINGAVKAHNARGIAVGALAFLAFAAFTQ